MYRSFSWLPYLFLLAPDNGAGSGGGASTTSGDAATGQNSGEGSDPTKQQEQGGGSPADTPQTAQDGQQQQEGDQGGEEQGEAGDTVSMPRKAFNKRIEQAETATTRKLLQGLGFEVPDDAALAQAQAEMQELITFAREQRASQMTAEERAQAEVQQAQTRATKAEGQVQTLTQERDQAQERLRNFVLRSAVIQEASENNATYPADVYTWVISNKREVLAAAIKQDIALFDDQGIFNPAAIDQEAVKGIVADCVKDRREWFKIAHGGVPSNGAAQPPQGAAQPDKKREAASGLIRL